MRTTYHNGRGRAQHNDREFIREGASIPANIDMNGERAIWTYKMKMSPDGLSCFDDFDGEWKDSLQAVELEYYRTHYMNALSVRNANYKKTGHSERCKTIEEWYYKTYPPEETILQIGTMHDIGETEEERDEFVRTFLHCLEDFVDWHETWNQEHGNHVHLLSMSIHLDESTPHVHIRRVYDYTDKNGNLVIGIDKALESAGIDIANPKNPPKEKSEKRFNNRKMAFDKTMREKWNQICEDWGFDIEHTPVTGKRSLTLTEYARKQEAERLEKTKQLEAKIKQIENIEAYIDTEQHVFEKRKKRVEEQLTERENKIAERETEFNNVAKQIKEMQDAEIRRLEHSPDVQPTTSFEQWVVKKNITLNNKPLFQFYQEDIRNQRIIEERKTQRQYKNEYAGAAAKLLQKAEEMQQKQQDYNYYTL